MLKQITLSLLFALFLTASFNTANAAFPTDKNSNAVVASSSAQTTDEAFSQNLSKKEFKKEAHELSKKGITASGGKSRIVAALLAFFLGGLGIHSFYMGMKQKGILQLGLSLAGLVLIIVGAAADISALAVVGGVVLFGVGIWAFVDFIRILIGSLEPEEGFID